MKLKQRPEDFVVEEISDFEPVAHGPLRVYRLTKRGLATLEVLQILAKRYSVPMHKLRVCGLKDKYAVSTQLLSTPRVLPEESNDPRWQVTFLGHSAEHVSSENLRGNRFQIVVRDLDDHDIQRVADELAEVRHGMPNYFDSQRFGSARHGQGFVAERLIRGDYEGAVRLLLTASSRYDHNRIKKRRRLIAQRWGEWEFLAKRVGYGDERPILRQLARDPHDYEAAFLKANRHLRALLIFAFQSFIWNETVKRLLEVWNLAALEAEYAMGTLLFPRFGPEGPPERLRTMDVPLVKHNTQLADADLRRCVDATLASLELSLEQLSFGADSPLFFKEIPRRLLLVPDEATWDGLGEDEHNPGKHAGRLTVALPSGAFATLFVKRLFQARPVDAR